MKNKKRLYSLIPLLAAVAVMIFLHTKYQCTNDDKTLIETVIKPSVWQEFSSVVYNFTSWSSRILVNLPIHIILHFPYMVWMVLEIIMWALIVFCLSYILIDNHSFRNNCILCGMVLLFPLQEVTSAGWATTTMTYIWPLAAGLVALTAIRYTQNHDTVKWYHYVIYGIAAIYGANQEQMSVFLFVIFSCYSIYLLVRKQKCALIFMEWFFVTGNLLLHVLAPGNNVRNLESVAVYFQDYMNLSAVDKLELGFSSTLYPFVLHKENIFMIMTIALCILVWQRQKKWIYRLLGAAPLCIHLVFGRFCEWFFEERQQIVFLSGHMHRTGVVTEMNYFNIQHYIPLMILFAAGISLMIAIYLAFGNSFKSVMAIAILFAGVGARMIVAFSSTVWASLNRTYTIFYFTLIGLTLMFANEIKTEKLKPLYYLLYAGLFYLAVTNVMAVYAVL